MTLTRKQSKRTARRVTRKSKRTTLGTRQVVERIDAMIRELEIMRPVPYSKRVVSAP